MPIIRNFDTNVHQPEAVWAFLQTLPEFGGMREAAPSARTFVSALNAVLPAAISCLNVVKLDPGFKTFVASYTVHKGPGSNRLEDVNILYYTPEHIAFVLHCDPSEWALKGALLHEFGHFVQGHNNPTADHVSYMEKERQADLFSGQEARRLGANEHQALSFLTVTYALTGEQFVQGDDQHPGLFERAEAVLAGWRGTAGPISPELTTWLTDSPTRHAPHLQAFNADPLSDQFNQSWRV